MPSSPTMEMIWDRLNQILTDQAALRSDLADIVAVLRELTTLMRDTTDIVTTGLGTGPNSLHAVEIKVSELAERVDALEGAARRVLQ